jgi:hypothetical protein
LYRRLHELREISVGWGISPLFFGYDVTTIPARVCRSANKENVMKKQPRTATQTLKLDLKAETLRKLSEALANDELEMVIGGERRPSGGSCGSPVGC